MGAFFAGVAKAPLGALLMVCEMTGGYGLVVPLMLTSVVAIVLSQRWSLYEKQVLNKFHSPAHRTDISINLLQTMKVKEVYRQSAPTAILPEDMSLAQLKRFITTTRESFFPVVDTGFHLCGILSLPDLREVLFEKSIQDLLLLRDVVSPPVSVDMEDSLYDALIKFLECGYGQIPIDNEQMGVVGILRFEDLMEAYHHEIQKMKEE
jgi:chloride channel protein, CIC family